MPGTYKKGDLVWIKLQGFPAWPGYILDDDLTHVQYLGDKRLDSIRDDNVYNFEKNYEYFKNPSFKKKNKRYKNAFMTGLLFAEKIRENILTWEDYPNFLLMKSNENKSKIYFKPSDIENYLKFREENNNIYSQNEDEKNNKKEFIGKKTKRKSRSKIKNKK